MKFLPPLPLKQKYFAPIEKEINRILWEVFYKGIVAALDAPQKEFKNEIAPLYIKRPILNAAEIIAWARAQGISPTLKAKDLHVTICHSAAGMDTEKVQKAAGSIAISQTSGRRVVRLGDKGAIVLMFISPALETRWNELLEKHGASWDFNSYIPHITLAYDPENKIDIEKIKPYNSILILGGEVHERTIKSWREKINELLNSVANQLEKSIRSGAVYYEGGEFKGSFNAFISKELRAIGAKYNKKTGAWFYSGALPPEISIAIAHAELEYSGLQKRVATAINLVDTSKIQEIAKTQELYGFALDEMDKEFEKSVKSITIPPKMTAGMKKAVADEWALNLNLYIQEWTDENILRLRSQVILSAFAGRRSKSMIADIQKNYGISKEKAKFLARQETSLLMSKFRESRYKDIGVTKYKWSGSMDERERKDHKRLEGQIIEWDNPPVTNLKTGARNHAGEDFGCRCVAVPIIE